MEYRNIEKLGVKTSLLGFGCMRYPTMADGKINEAEAEKMLDRALAAGVTYIDTAYPYHDGASEPFTGKVLNKYPRDSYYLATKLPTWIVNSVEDVNRIFQEQLQRLDKEYVDFYLLHALDKSKWDKMKELGVIEACEKLKAEGKIKYLGFSFHDDYSVFEEILTYRDWDFCQIQLNYMDTEDGPGMRGYDLTVKQGVPVVIMEPVKGGSLAVLPEDINAEFTAARPESSTASWALRWIASKPNVRTVLSGMSAMDQLEDNLSTFGNFEPMKEQEEKTVEKVASTIRSRVKNGCTSCRYCMPCPAGVDIPRNFSVWNHHAMYGNDGWAKQEYFKNVDEKAQADKCISCGACEKVCPQHLLIREDLKRVHSDMLAI